jgi:hypothetical protein
MKCQLSLAVILSTSAIASGILLSSVSKAEACSHSKSDYDQERSEQVTWLGTPLAALVTIPGIAIATALSIGNRRYNRQD